MADKVQGPEREKAVEGNMGTRRIWRGQAEAERKRSIERLGRPETRQSIGKYVDKPYQNEVGLCSD